MKIQQNPTKLRNLSHIALDWPTSKRKECDANLRLEQQSALRLDLDVGRGRGFSGSVGHTERVLACEKLSFFLSQEVNILNLNSGRIS